MIKMFGLLMICMTIFNIHTIDAQTVIGATSTVGGAGFGGGFLFVFREQAAVTDGFVTSVSFVPFSTINTLKIYVLRKVATLNYHVVGKVDITGSFASGAVRTAAITSGALPINTGDFIAFSIPSGNAIQTITTTGTMEIISIGSGVGPADDTCAITSLEGTRNNAAISFTITNNVAAVAEYDGTVCAAAAIGDPQFTGLQGQSFQIHGFADSYFSLISTPTFQMNGRFAYIASAPTCQRNDTVCWQHPGTYIDDIGFLVTLANGEHLRIEIVAGSQTEGMKVYINGTAVHFRHHALSYQWNGDCDGNDMFCVNDFSYQWLSPFTFHIRTNLWDITAVNSQDFYNLQVAMLDGQLLKSGRVKHMIQEVHAHGRTHAQESKVYPQLPIHGFIGNTWKNARYPDGKLYQGCVHDYETSSVFGTDAMFNQYGKRV